MLTNDCNDHGKIVFFERELALLVALQVLSSKGDEGGRMREDEGELSDKILLGQE